MNKYLLFFSLFMCSFNLNAQNYIESKQCVHAKEEKCLIDIRMLTSDVSITVSSNSADKNIAILGHYYDLAKKNDLAALIKLFSEADGSRQIIKEQVRKNPSMYSRFHKVEKVIIVNSARLGDYYSYRVRWISKEEEILADWLELVHCPGQCYMSARVLDQTDETYFYAIATSISPKGQGVIVNENTVRIDHPQTSNYAVSVNVNTVKAEDQNGLANISGFLSHMKQDYEDIVGAAESNWDKKYQQLINIYSTYWSGIESSTSFQLESPLVH